MTTKTLRIADTERNRKKEEEKNEASLPIVRTVDHCSGDVLVHKEEYG